MSLSLVLQAFVETVRNVRQRVSGSVLKVIRKMIFQDVGHFWPLIDNIINIIENELCYSQAIVE